MELGERCAGAERGEPVGRAPRGAGATLRSAAAGGAELGVKPGTLEPQTSPAGARASDAGDYAKFCYLRNLGNPCFTVPSGWGVVDLAAVPLSSLPGTFDNNIESVYTNKRMVALYDYYFEGDPLFLRSNGPKLWNLADWGYANRATSVWAGWAGWAN